MSKKQEVTPKKIQVSIVMSRAQKAEYTRLALEMDMSFSRLIRTSLRDLKAKKDQAATRS